MITIPNPIASAASSRPDHIVLQDDARALTARHLLEAVRLQAAFLRAEGVEPGDVVAVCGEAGVDWVVCFHAIGFVGATVAPLPRARASQLSALQAFQPRLVVSLANIESPLDSWPHCPVVIPGQSTAEVPERFWPLCEPRLLVLTSGTTGVPRAVSISTAQLVFNAFGSATRLGLDPHDCWLACLPFEHVGGLAVLWRSAFYGTGVRVLPRFDAERVNHLVDGGHVSLVSLVPTMLERVLEQRRDRPFPASLRAILVGGAAASASLVARCKAIGAPVALSWGMTETASQVATTYPHDLMGDGDVGPPLPFARVDVTPNQQLTVSGPITNTGVVLTNDLGGVDLNGRVRVDGRADDVIISGGEKIDPALVERVLCQYEAIAAAAVVGVADPHLGERPFAFLVLRAGATPPTDDELRRLCEARLPRHCIPSRFVWRDGLDTTHLGKVTRASLRAEAAALAMASARSLP